MKPINLPGPRNKLWPGLECIALGWGRLNAPYGKYSNTLQEVKMTVQPDQKCESQYKDYYDPDTQLCVGDPKSKRTTYKVRLGLTSGKGG